MKLLLLTLLSLTLLTTAQAAPTLTKAQRQKLAATGTPIVLPTDIPPGFTITDVITNGCKAGSTKPGCRFGPQSTIVYRNPKNTCLLVNMISDGIGGGAAEFETRTQTKLLGEVLILFGQPTGDNKAPTQDDLQTYQPNLSSFPAAIQNIRSSPYYSLTIAQTDGYYAQFKCDLNSSITPTTLEKIVQSLAIVK